MPAPTFDAVSLELTRQRLEAAAEEMGIVLQRTALSANIKERRDFSCALFDASGRLVAQAAHVPVHLGSMPASVAAVLERLGPLEDGQTAIVNDPYAGGTHLPDITLVSAVFVKGERVGYAANRAHHADVGGSTPGSMTLSTHIDEEGVRIPPTLLDETALENLLSQVRTPAERRGDLRAQELANAAGAAALSRVVETDGVEGLAALIDYAERMTRETIRTIPAGVYTAADRMDDDGTPNGSPVTIRLTLTIAEEAAAQSRDREGASAPHRGSGALPDGRGSDVSSSGPLLTADFSASDATAAGCVNCPASVTASAVYYCLGCLLPDGVPLNSGCFAPVAVVTKPGTIVHAAHPAAVVAGNTETSQRVVDVVFAALRQALPSRIPAESCGTMSSLALGTADWTYYETVGGGSGAGPTWDGESAVQCHMTNTLNTPAEALEMQYPLRVTRFARRDGSGGAGTHKGGDGILRELEVLADCDATLLGDRRLFPPGNGRVGVNTLNGRDVGGKVVLHLKRGDVLRTETPGGAGMSDTKPRP